MTSVTFSKGSVVQKEVTNHYVRKGGVLQRGGGGRKDCGVGRAVLVIFFPAGGFTC